MFIHPYTIQLCSQEINSTPSGKDMPFIRQPIDLTKVTWKELTQDQLDHIYSEAQEITSIIEAETFRRLNDS